MPACRLVSLYLFFYFFVIILFLSSSAFCHHLTSGFLNLVIIDELQRIILGDQGPGDNAALIYKSRLPLFAQGRVEIMLNSSKEPLDSFKGSKLLLVISYKLLLSCTFCHTKQINMRLAYIVSFDICQLSMAIKRRRRRENKAMAKDKVDHTSSSPWTPWTTPGPVKLLEERKSRFCNLNNGSSGIVLPTLAAPAFCEDQNDAALNQGLARLGKVGHTCLSSAASSH